MPDEYRLWLHIEHANEEEDIYEDQGEPEPVGRFETLEEAERAASRLVGDVHEFGAVDYRLLDQQIKSLAGVIAWYGQDAAPEKIDQITVSSEHLKGLFELLCQIHEKRPFPESVCPPEILSQIFAGDLAGVIVKGRDICNALAVFLVKYRSAGFQVDPLPHDEYRITYKRENHHAVLSWFGRPEELGQCEDEGDRPDNDEAHADVADGHSTAAY